MARSWRMFLAISAANSLTLRVWDPDPDPSRSIESAVDPSERRLVMLIDGFECGW